MIFESRFAWAALFLLAGCATEAMPVETPNTPTRAGKTDGEGTDCSTTQAFCVCLYEQYAGCAGATTEATCRTAAGGGDCVWQPNGDGQGGGFCISDPQLKCENFYAGDAACRTVRSVAYPGPLPTDLEPGDNAYWVEYFGHQGEIHRFPEPLRWFESVIDARGDQLCSTHYTDHGCKWFENLESARNLITEYSGSVPTWMVSGFTANQACSNSRVTRDENGVITNIEYSDAAPYSIYVDWTGIISEQ